MDLTIDYFKMCEKAFPYIGIIEPDKFEAFSWQKGHDRVIENLYGKVLDKGIFLGLGHAGGETFQIYYLSQLIKALPNNKTPWIITNDIENSINTAFGCQDYFALFTSMEQLLLALIMEKKFKRIWNGENFTEE